jgi:UDP-3-O-[3-hydroxymyristoyl] glucosamine N-acyltransferase
VTIGDGAVVAAQSGVSSDLKPGDTVFGTPARPHKEMLKISALWNKLPEMYETFKALKKKSSPEI